MNTDWLLHTGPGQYISSNNKDAGLKSVCAGDMVLGFGGRFLCNEEQGLEVEGSAGRGSAWANSVFHNQR